jgi:integrase/recombinase XerD
MSKRPLASTLGPTVCRYLDLKEALGRKYAIERSVLEQLDEYLAASATDLTSDSFGRWCHTQQHLTSTVRRNRMRIVRNLCLYRRRTDLTCFVPDPSQFPSNHQPVQPYLFTEQEVARLLRATADLKPISRSPLRREVFRLAIVLLYTTGLRRGELLRLTVGDYDSREKTLLVRASKFHKSRLLPLSPDGVHELEAYLALRRIHGSPITAEAPLLWNGFKGGRPYTGVGLGEGVRLLCRATEIATPAGRAPRVHDFRHAFAIHALVRWYREGADVQAKLPYLATYMGHVSIASTQYYLQFVDELARCASERFARHCGSLVTTSSTAPAPGGAR